MPRSLHIIGSGGSGGAERFFVRLVNALAEGGHPVMAITRPDAQIQKHLAANVAQRAIPMRNNWDILSRWQIRRTVDEFRPDIVQTYMGRATRLTQLRDKSRTKHLARLGGYYESRHYRHADACVALTQGIRDYLMEEGFPGDRVFYIPNFVDPPPPLDQNALPALRARLGVPVDHLVILGIGRLHPNKGFCDLIAAFSQLPESVGGQELSLVIVGAGPLEESLQHQASRLGLDDRIIWTGWQDHPENYYRMSHLMVCPSRHEPHGNVILEAWACGTPVLSTATGGGKELITSDVNGILVPCQEVAQMACAMETLLGNPSVRRKLADSGKKTLAERFSKEAVIKTYLETYKSILSG
jgi:glycosyltransferase involved in cell wall biosynthesis